MSEAPERVKLAHNGGLPTGNYPESAKVEYIRADLVALLRDAIARVINPAPGVTKIEPWAHGILTAALASMDAGK